MSRKTYDAVLENNSWADIQEALRNGNPAGWKVGDTKTVIIGVNDEGEFTDGAGAYDVRLVDLTRGRYKDADGTDNVAVFEFVKLIINTPKAVNYKKKTYNEITSYTAGGWANSDLRKYMNGSNFLGGFPNELKNVMLSAKVGSAAYGGCGQTDTTRGGVIIYSDGDKLFVGAQSEYFSSSTKFYSYNTERALYPQWDYYKVNDTDSARAKVEVNRYEKENYWNRSPHYGTTQLSYGDINCFCGVGNGGNARNWDAQAMSTYIAPVFVL